MNVVDAIVQRLRPYGDTAYGNALFFRELLNLVNLRLGGNSPIIVEYMGKDGATREMMFGRQSLSTNFSSALNILKNDFGLVPSGHSSNQVVITVTGGLFYNADGTVQTTLMSMSEGTWADLMPHVHKIFIRAPSDYVQIIA